MVRRRVARRCSAVLIAFAIFAAPAVATPLDDATATHALSVSRDKLARAAARLPATELPKSTGPDGLWRTVPADDVIGWTQGFFAGSLWYQYELTGDAAWRDRAETFTRSLEGQKTNTVTHDTGLKLFPSYGNAYRLTGDPAFRDVLLTGAASLATRYRPEIGAIDCCDWNPDWRLPVVIDTMMNIELLFWAGQHGGDAGLTRIALEHALRTRDDLVRADGSTFHVADYEPGTGALRWRGTYQGAADDSTWSRGQAWAVYGFTAAYRYTRDERMLAAARHTADFFLTRLPASRVPNWDLDASQQLDDSSAASIFASALLELATFAAEPDATRYRTSALQILDALASSAYLDERLTTEGVLLHGAGHVPARQEMDVSLVYGDYYFVEALLRARPWPDAGGGGGGGTGDGGGGGGGGGTGDGAGGGGTDGGTGSGEGEPSPRRSGGCNSGGTDAPLFAVALALTTGRSRRGHLARMKAKFLWRVGMASTSLKPASLSSGASSETVLSPRAWPRMESRWPSGEWLVAAKSTTTNRPPGLRTRRT